MKTLKHPDGYNGWTNYATWNVALWLGNDEELYALAITFPNYRDLLPLLDKWSCRPHRKEHAHSTPDMVQWRDEEINHDEINEMLADLSD